MVLQKCVGSISDEYSLECISLKSIEKNALLVDFLLHFVSIIFGYLQEDFFKSDVDIRPSLKFNNWFQLCYTTNALTFKLDFRLNDRSAIN